MRAEQEQQQQQQKQHQTGRMEEKSEPFQSCLTLSTAGTPVGTNFSTSRFAGPCYNCTDAMVKECSWCFLHGGFLTVEPLGQRCLGGVNLLDPKRQESPGSYRWHHNGGASSHDSSSSRMHGTVWQTPNDNLLLFQVDCTFFSALRGYVRDNSVLL